MIKLWENEIQGNNANVNTSIELMRSIQRIL